MNSVPPRPRPRRMGTLPAKVDPCLEIPEATCVKDAVRRLEHDRELDASEHAAREDAGQRALLELHFLTREDDVPGREPARASSSITATPPFMSLAPRPCTASPSIRPGMLPCAGTVST